MSRSPAPSGDNKKLIPNAKPFVGMTVAAEEEASLSVSKKGLGELYFNFLARTHDAAIGERRLVRAYDDVIHVRILFKPLQFRPIPFHLPFGLFFARDEKLESTMTSATFFQSEAVPAFSFQMRKSLKVVLQGFFVVSVELMVSQKRKERDPFSRVPTDITCRNPASAFPSYRVWSGLPGGGERLGPVLRFHQRSVPVPVGFFPPSEFPVTGALRIPNNHKPVFRPVRSLAGIRRLFKRDVLEARRGLRAEDKTKSDQAHQLGKASSLHHPLRPINKNITRQKHGDTRMLSVRKGTTRSTRCLRPQNLTVSRGEGFTK